MGPQRLAAGTAALGAGVSIAAGFPDVTDHLRAQLCLQQNVCSRTIEGVVSPGRSICAIEAVDVEMESPGVAAVAKV